MRREKLTLLRDLAEAGVKPAGMPALALYPAVFVAWSDGLVEAKERELVERLAKGLPEPVRDQLKIVGAKTRCLCSKLLWKRSVSLRLK